MNLTTTLDQRRQAGSPAGIEDQLRSIRRKIESVVQRGYVILEDGGRRPITGSVSVDEALRLAGYVLQNNCRITLETGVAFGISTLAMMLAHDALESGSSAPEGPPRVHYGVDPCQWSEHHGAAIALHREFGIRSRFELLEGTAHVMLPTLLEKVTLDFAFVDGWHTFDYTLIDFFYIDKLLKPGGAVAFHDASWASKRKVFGYIRTHRRYRPIGMRSVPAVTFAKQLVLALSHASFRRAIYSAQPGLLLWQKIDGEEPGHDFFRNF